MRVDSAPSGEKLQHAVRQQTEYPTADEGLQSRQVPFRSHLQRKSAPRPSCRRTASCCASHECRGRAGSRHLTILVRKSERSGCLSGSNAQEAPVANSAFSRDQPRFDAAVPRAEADSRHASGAAFSAARLTEMRRFRQHSTSSPSFSFGIVLVALNGRSGSLAIVVHERRTRKSCPIRSSSRHWPRCLSPARQVISGECSITR